MSFVVSSCNCCWLRNIKTVGIGGTGGAISLPNFGRSVNPSLIRLCPLHYHPGFQTFLRFCTYRHKRKGTLQESKCLCLALQWGNWIRTSCSFASKNEARIPLSSWSSSLRAEDVWNPFRQYQHYYSTASYSIPGLRPRVQYWSFRRRRPAAAVARSQKQRRQYRAGGNVGEERAIILPLHILAGLET